MPEFDLARMIFEQARGNTLVEIEDCGFTNDQRAAQKIAQAAIDTGSPVYYAFDPEKRECVISIDGLPINGPEDVTAMMIGTLEDPQNRQPS